jgi:hypothetical protein
VAKDLAQSHRRLLRQLVVGQLPADELVVDRPVERELAVRDGF